MIYIQEFKLILFLIHFSVSGLVVLKCSLLVLFPLKCFMHYHLSTHYTLIFLFYLLFHFDKFFISNPKKFKVAFL